MWTRVTLMLILLAGARLASAQDTRPSGLGAERDTLALAVGQTAAQLPAGIIPGSFRVDVLRDSAFVELSAELFRIDTGAGLFRLNAPADSVVIFAFAYRRVPQPGIARIRLPSADSLRAAEARPDSSGGRSVDSAPAAVLAGSRLQTSGSITRGVVAGSSRDASISSGLRLSLSGEVAPGVTIRGALTDESTPILPEGTTQQLSDLDRVYVEVESRRARARLGDVDLELAGTSFAPLTRTVQGAVFEADFPESGAIAGGRVLASASATRGEYRTQELSVQEGVQGPYRLLGAQGASFVVVVPGSERVFLDGRRLDRGLSADYTIDYGVGEITFTPANLITAERRATVDFEYTTGGFTRTLVASAADASVWKDATGAGRARFGARYLREADASSFATEIGLTEAELDAIAAAGNSDVLVDGAERVPFDPESPFVLYTRADTTVAGVPTQIFVPASADSPDVFRVRFTRVALGRGDYRRSGQIQNGLFYEYVGEGNGDAIPFRLLPRPAARRLVDLTGVIEPIPGLELFGEFAHSADDANTLSSIDDGSGIGGAYEMGLRLKELGLGLGTLSGDVVRRDRSDSFRTMDRVRDVDFARRWNLSRSGSLFSAALDSLGESLTEGSLRWEVAEQASVGAEIGRLSLGGLNAERGAVVLQLGSGSVGPAGLPVVVSRTDGARTRGSGRLAASAGTGRFIRHRTDVLREVGRFQPSLAFTVERRDQSDTALADTLLSPSYAFRALAPGLGFDSGVVRTSATVELRSEQEPLGPIGAAGPLVDAARAVTVETQASVRPSGATSADLRVAYRRKSVADAFQEFGRVGGESVAVRLSGRAAPGGGAVDVQTVYDALTERSPVLQETYVLVGPDLGAFVWRDGQGEARAGEPDGVAQIDEFFPETTPLEGTFLRTFVPSDELLPSVGVGLSFRLGVRPARFILGDGLLARALQSIALRTLVDVREKTRETDVFRVLLLDSRVLQQTADAQRGTLTGRFRIEQEVVMLPDNPVAGARLTASHLTTTSRQAAGLETRLQQSVRLEVYTPLSDALAFRAEALVERRRAESQAFASRTYDLRGVRAEPKLTWSPNETVQVIAAAVASTRTDAFAFVGRPTGATIFLLPVEIRLARASRFTVSARAELASIRLRGGSGAGLALFELTDGRGPGTSVMWGANAQLGLATGLRGSLVYEGRAPADAPVVHTARMQVTAVF